MKKVSFDIPVLVKFEEGQDMIIRIYKQSLKAQPKAMLSGFAYKDRNSLKKGLGLLISKDTPLAQAILNQPEGKTVEYTIKDKKNKQSFSTNKVHIAAIY